MVWRMTIAFNPLFAHICDYQNQQLMKNLLIIIFLPVTAFAQNTVCLDLVANPDAGQAAFADFTKYVNVFGFKIYGENGITDAQVLHVAAVTAELLDQDEDGTADDPVLLSQLLSEGALMPIFNSEGSPANISFENNYNGAGVSAVLRADEIDPTQPGHWGSDATVEEVLHTINHVGHIQLYPTIFGIDPNSSTMSDAMDLARGGQFLTIPNPYPAAAWYHYDDQTCDYGCMAVEYMYWCIVSWMGILNDAATCSGIANEWEPCSPTLLQSTDVAMHGLITEVQYKLPQLAPDGNYCPSGTGITEQRTASAISVFPNPANGSVSLELKEAASVRIVSTVGNMVYRKALPKGKTNIDVSEFSGGVYFVHGTYSAIKLVIE